MPGRGVERGEWDVGGACGMRRVVVAGGRSVRDGEGVGRWCLHREGVANGCSKGG